MEAYVARINQELVSKLKGLGVAESVISKHVDSGDRKWLQFKPNTAASTIIETAIEAAGGDLSQVFHDKAALKRAITAWKRFEAIKTPREIVEWYVSNEQQYGHFAEEKVEESTEAGVGPEATQTVDGAPSSWVADELELENFRTLPGSRYTGVGTATLRNGNRIPVYHVQAPGPEAEDQEFTEIRRRLGTGCVPRK